MTRFIVCMMIFIFSSLAAQAQAQEGDSYYTYLQLPLPEKHKSADVFVALEKTNDTLYEALALAYQNNPTLQAARAELLAVQEKLPQAQAGFKPVITANADATHTDTDTKGTSFITSDGGNFSKSASFNLDQPVFRGGRTYADIRNAKNIISAQNLALSAAEQGVIYDAAVAYMNVLRDKALLKLNENNRILVEQEQEQAQNRFTVGELTRTDVSQSAARLAEADADVITANGALQSSIAVYRQIIGTLPPEAMAYPARELPLPETLEDALAIARSNNRDILQAKFINAAAEDSVDSVFGEILPQISAIGNLTKSYDPSDFIDEQKQASIGLNASVPLYQAGATISRVREAKKRANQRYLQIIEAQSRVRQEALSNWEALETAKAEITARQSQVEASLIANQGVHYEEEFGERTTLDALDANQELLDAQVSLITARRNQVVARFALARSLGLLVPQNLNFSTVNP